MKEESASRPQVLKDLDTIVDFMVGADGGVGFMEPLVFFRHIADDPAAGSVALREVVARFARLCRMAGEGRLLGHDRG